VERGGGGLGVEKRENSNKKKWFYLVVILFQSKNLSKYCLGREALAKNTTFFLVVVLLLFVSVLWRRQCRIDDNSKVVSIAFCEKVNKILCSLSKNKKPISSNEYSLDH
jgi:hypothetical protein